MRLLSFKRPVKLKEQESVRPMTLGIVVAWVKANKFETGLFLALLAVSIVVHAWNMFNFPYYENDEATYVSRAWTFITEGELDVYTYRYDHAPLGWILIGLWQLVSGGAHLFGSLLENGRTLMLLLHTASTVLIYILAKRFSGGSMLAGAIATIFFALSPLGIFFQRRVLLDNIMTFWLLLSLFFASQPVKRLKNYILSGLTFGIAVLTKLNAIFFGPAILFIVWVAAHKNHRLHAGAYWMTIAGMVVASFFMYALLKGEFFPAPLDAAGNPGHVSVVDTFALQLGRGEFAWPWLSDSSFMQNVKSWLLKDWSILSLGALATAAVTVVGIWRRKTQPYILALAMLIVLYVAFLGRGKLVLDLYIVPLVPLLAMAIGVFATIVYRDWLHQLILKRAFLTVTILVTVLLYMGLPNHHYWRNETSNQLAAVEWVKKHVPENAVIAADNYIYPYLAQEGGYKNVSYFFSTEYDPEVRKVYDDDWRNIEYLVLTHEIVKQIKTGTVPRMKNLLDHSVLLADYRQDTSSYIDLPSYISTNGDWAQIYKIKSRVDIVLQDSWQHFKDRFVVDYGQVVDLTNNSLTTSASQAQAMLRAVSEDDQAMFGGLWQWNKDHLRYRANDKLLSWKWELKADKKTYGLADSNNVCDADQQIAYALFLADEKWPGRGYGREAQTHINDWWRQCTFERVNQRFVDSSADGSQDIKLINTGYFRPAIYAYLSKKAPDLPWQQLTDNGFTLLERVHDQYGTMPDWVVMSLDGSLMSAAPLVGQAADSFGYDALQLIPSMVETYGLTDDIRAQKLLQRLAVPTARFASATNSPPSQTAKLLLDQVLEDGHDDKLALVASYESVVYKSYRPGNGYWQDGYNYRDQVWLWQWHESQAYLKPGQRINLH